MTDKPKQPPAPPTWSALEMNDPKLKKEMDAIDQHDWLVRINPNQNCSLWRIIAFSSEASIQRYVDSVRQPFAKQMFKVDGEIVPQIGDLTVTYEYKKYGGYYYLIWLDRIFGYKVDEDWKAAAKAGIQWYINFIIKLDRMG